MTSIDEQREMRRTVADLLDREAGGRAIREAMATEQGFDPRLWHLASAELGLTAVLVPERCGGLGLEFTDAAVVLQEFGRRVVPGPVPETLIGSAVLAACGTEPADDLLRRIADGGLAVASAVAEAGTGWEVDRVDCGAAGEAGDPGVTVLLTGRKELVAFGAAADVLLVVARDVADAGAAGAGVGLFAVSAAHPGVHRQPRMTLDQTRRLADITLADVPAVRISVPGDGQRIVRLLVELSWVALAVESAAAAAAALAMTVEYLKVRRQFDKPLGSFQALKHRCADLAVLVEGASATAAHAVETVASGSEELTLVAPLAKAVCADVLRDVAAEMIQLHGGIGFTFEHDAHLYFKRGKANQQFFGSGDILRRRIGDIAGL